MDNGKTLGQVAFDAYNNSVRRISRPLTDTVEKYMWESAAKAVLNAQPSQAQNEGKTDIDKELLWRVKNRYLELTSCLPCNGFNAMCKIVKEEVARAQLSQEHRNNNDIERYHPNYDAGCMQIVDDGRFVLFEEHLEHVELYFEEINALKKRARLSQAQREQNAALLWVLWHHQGGSSEVGQPIRKLLGIGPHERLTEDQISAAKSFGTGA